MVAGGLRGPRMGLLSSIPSSPPSDADDDADGVQAFTGQSRAPASSSCAPPVPNTGPPSAPSPQPSAQLTAGLLVRGRRLVVLEQGRRLRVRLLGLELRDIHRRATRYSPPPPDLSPPWQSSPPPSAPWPSCVCDVGGTAPCLQGGVQRPGVRPFGCPEHRSPPSPLFLSSPLLLPFLLSRPFPASSAN